MEPKVVRDIMTVAVKTLGRNDQLSIVDDLMQAERIRHLPVLDSEGQLCGIVSQRDMFRGALAAVLGYGEVAQRKLLATLVVKEVMRTDVITIAPGATIREAAGLMLERKVGCLPVVEQRRLVGILTETDLVKLAARSYREEKVR